MGCNLYKKPFLFDVDYNQFNIDISKLRDLIPRFDPATSGLWFPVIVKSSQSNTSKVDPLIPARSNVVSASFDPTNCIPDTTKDYDQLESDPIVNCQYCSVKEPNYQKQWQLKDTEGNVRQTRNGDLPLEDQYIYSNCCNGACDTRMKKDDYIPKIPFINQNYITSFSDFKYLNQFPATNNPGLGFEDFITLNENGLSSFNISPSLIIDWKLRETISEIPYDELTSQHANIEQHNKSFNKSLNTNRTCGNFILTQINPAVQDIHPAYPIFSGLIGDSDQSRVTLPLGQLLPVASNFTNPYGFSKNTYDNIFIHNEKLGSHWKWNYSSGVLCWYRYFDTNLTNDPRPIRGIDLYISPGDVFFATNDGPEPLPVAYDVNRVDIKPCPSGIKLLKNGSVAGVIPSGSNFTYISSNIYNKFIELYERISEADILDETNMTPKARFDLAALMSTAPEYDEITVDLLKRNRSYEYNINQYKQITELNKDMTTSKIGSVSKLNFIADKESLINTLADKYGCYLWFPPGSNSEARTTTLKLSNKIKSQCLIDLEFDVVFDHEDTQFALGASCDTTIDCDDNIFIKSFVYNQQFSLGNIKVNTEVDTSTRYATKCAEKGIVKTKSAKTAGIFLNNGLIKEIIYNSGCSVFQDNYPRIITDSTPNTSYCSECGSESSYKLPNVQSDNICRGYSGDQSWCDATLARFYNNSEGQNITGDRLSRSILDGTLYFKRTYPVNTFNPHIDRLAFHSQGGLYYVSNILGGISGTTIFAKNASQLFTGSDGDQLSISFTNKNVGIKLFNISIQKLRSSSSDTYDCKAFPVKDSCQCFNLSTFADYPSKCGDGAITYTNNPILYTPGLSTNNSPRLKAYGGYSLEKIAELLGGADIVENISRTEQQILATKKKIALTVDPDTLSTLNNTLSELLRELSGLRESLSLTSRIPNHPAPGSLLSPVNTKIDPLNPYGCEKSVTITLNNYVATNWTVLLPSYNTIHADVWAEVLENVNLFKSNVFSVDFDSGDIVSTPNQGYQRFTTKVVLNENITIYDQQKKAIINKGGGQASSVVIDLVNPFLSALIGRRDDGNDFCLYPPAGSLCDTNNVFATRGDEISSIPIKFSRIPRKQILNFSIPAYTAMGNLKRGFFHPNSGLSFNREYFNLSPIIQDRSKHTSYIDYEKEVFNPEASYGNGLVLIGELNSDIERVLTQVNNFSDHRKLRLYLKLGDGWYMYNNPNSFGFFNKEQLYVGEPFMFEYLSSEDKSTIQGPWTQTCAKEPIEFDFLYNYRPTGTSILDYNTNKYPLYIASVSKNPNKQDTVMLDGARPYFYIGEKENVVVSNSSSIEGLDSVEQDLISTTNPVVLLTNGDRWKYLGGSKTSLSSYELTDYNYLYSNFSSLHIDYALKSKKGYVYNTKMFCDQDVTIVNKANPKQKYTSKIIEKSIYSFAVDQYGNSLDADSINPGKYIKIYTRLKLDKKLKYDNAYLDFSTLYNNFQTLNGIDSFIVYRDFKPLLKNETDELLRNSLFSTKWGDVIEFDNRLSSELNQYISSAAYINNNYPYSLYDNLFYKIIINNTNIEKFNYIIKPKNNSDIQVSYDGPVYYTLHQKYNIGSNNYLTKSDFHSQDNYLPLIDINFIPTPGTNSQSVRGQISQQLSSLQNQSLLNGKIIISGAYKNLAPDHEWGDFKSPNDTRYFWINMNPSNKLKSALSFTSETHFYSNTLRVDDPPFTLSSLNSSMQFGQSNCFRSFTASLPNYNNLTISSNNLNFTNFNTNIFQTDVFARYPIYCDTDTVGNCASQLCGINTAGWTTVKADYTTYTEKEPDISSILSNSIPFMLSYDAGLYNIVGNTGIKYIQRFELEPNNILYPESACDSSVGPRPAAARYSVLNSEYQSLLSNSIVNDHTSVVTNTDILANEMLFRLLYGEQQRINLDRIDGSRDRVTLTDLLKYSYPKVEAKDVYKNIPYDLDIDADISNRKTTGSISIDGILAVGKNITITINNLDINIKISRVNGKIKAIASISGHDSLESILYSEEDIYTTPFVSTQPVFPANEDEYFDDPILCKERQQVSINLSSKIVKATIKNRACDGTDVEFPYWKASDNPNGRPCNPNGLGDNIWGACLPERVHLGWGNYIDIRPEDRGHPGIAFVNVGGCAGTATTPYNACTNRGVGETQIPNGCSIIAAPKNPFKATLRSNGVSRGVMYGCHINGGTATTQYDLAYTNEGGIESFISTSLIDGVRGLSLNPRYESSDCGTCFSLNASSWNNIPIYNSLGRDWPVVPVTTNDACECSDYTYGYCRSSENIQGCACKSLNYEYADFDYNFEYCRHSIKLKGFKRKLTGYLKDPKMIIDDPPDFGGRVAPTTLASGDIDNLKIEEECVWYSCPLTNPITYYVYNRQNIIRRSAYATNCPTRLCDITYNNNSTTIVLSGANGLISRCIKNSLGSDCPKIRVVVPDDSFKVVDSINSSCDICGSETDEAIMIDQHPAWDIITETRTCVLGYLLQNNPNTNGPVGIGGCQTIPCDICLACPDANSCNGWSSTHCGRGLCGKSAPESFPWHVCINKIGGGSVGIPGNTDAVRLIGEYFGGQNPNYNGRTPTIIGCDIPVNFDLATSGAGNRLLNSEWESNMKQAYDNIAVCKNNIDRYRIEDIVEGVIPGTCGKLTFTELIYPGIKYRSTLGSISSPAIPDVEDIDIIVRLAYYTYQYRRPKTIQDILKGVETSIKCNEQATSCMTSNIRLSSAYKSIDCNSTPICYNTDASRCDSTNRCCQAGRIQYE